MRMIAVAVSASVFCAIAPIYTSAKSDRPTCVQRCREYYCSGGVTRQLYCQAQCVRKCQSREPEQK